MKKLFISFVIFSALFIIGCQENSITNPVPDMELNKPNESQILQGTIKLEGILLDRSVPFTNYLSISGCIEYVHEILFVDPIPPAVQYYVSISLSASAILEDSNSPKGNSLVIIQETRDVFYVSIEDIYLLEKAFPIQGRTDGMVLMCRFLVTTDGIGLSEMWLGTGSDISAQYNFKKKLSTIPHIQL